MPNWSSNTITISGPKPVIDRLEDHLRVDAGGEIDSISILQSLYPMPDALHGTVSPARDPHSADAIDAAEPAARAAMLEENLEWETAQAALRAAYGHTNWYDWSVANWGVKWPDRTYRFQRRARSIVIDGETPWGPPIEGLETISKRIPEIRIGIKYFECGMGFAGSAAFSGGAVLYHTQRRYRGGRGG